MARAGWQRNGNEFVGVDISAAIDTACQRLGEIEGTSFVQADILALPFPPSSFDLVFSEGVLHHTPSTEAAFKALARLLRPGGEIMIYVYRRKAPAREFVDDYIRERIAGLPPEEAWDQLRPLTRLGQALAELETRSRYPEDVELLGIPKGVYDVQRLVYWHFAKLFWNPHDDVRGEQSRQLRLVPPALRAPAHGGRGARLVRGLRTSRSCGSTLRRRASRCAHTALVAVCRDHRSRDLAWVVPPLHERPARQPEAPPLVDRRRGEPQSIGQRLGRGVDYRELRRAQPERRDAAQVESGNDRLAERHRLDGEPPVPACVELIHDDCGAFERERTTSDSMPCRSSKRNGTPSASSLETAATSRPCP